MTQPLTEMEYRAQAERAYVAVFANDDAFDEPFRPEIRPRLLLYDFRWVLHTPWLEPIVETMHAMGEKGFYVSALKRPDAGRQDQPYHWYVPISEAADYGDGVYSQENAVYSVNGRWGIICSGEDHALAAGPSVLIEAIRLSVPDLEERTREFIELWKHYHENNKISINWLPRLLSHVYGPEAMRGLLTQAKLHWLLGK